MTPSPSITGFHHVAINARKNYDQAVAFYKSTLGLVQRVEFVFGGRRASMLDAGAGNYVEIFDFTNDQAESKPTLLSHLALCTNDVDAMIKRVRDAGMKITVEPKDVELQTNVGPNPFVVRIAFFEGPEGESVELFEEKTPLISPS